MGEVRKEEIVERRYLVSAEEMKQYDKNTIEYYGIPSLVLMERAALSVYEELTRRVPADRKVKVLVAAGCGNNGGDGIAIGRMLMLQGYQVQVCLIGERTKCTEQTRQQLAIWEKYGCSVQSKIEETEYDIMVDALFGIGLSRRVEGIYGEVIDRINRMKQNGGKKVLVCAVDIPSGIHTDTGEVMGTAVRADLTVTFGFEKLGHILYPGCEYAGEVVCADIGITKESFLGESPRVYTYGQKVNYLMPPRNRGGNKGTFGKVLIIAGSRNMSGACELCARSCYRTGAGMVKIITEEANREIIQQDIPEALFSTCLTKADMEWADCMVIGPGLGKSAAAYEMLKTVLTESEKPLLIDADGLNLLAESAELREYLEKKSSQSGAARRTIIITPHLGEFAGLYGCSVAEAKKDILNKPGELAERFGCTVVCKDARTVVAAAGEESIFLNTTGNDGMATAGMGDVLAGIIGGLLAQGMKALEAAALGVYLHGTAGDAAAAVYGHYGLMAGDVVELLGAVTLQEE